MTCALTLSPSLAEKLYQLAASSYMLAAYSGSAKPHQLRNDPEVARWMAQMASRPVQVL